VAPHLTLVPKGNLIKLPSKGEEKATPGIAAKHDKFIEVLEHIAPVAVNEHQRGASELHEKISTAKQEKK